MSTALYIKLTGKDYLKEFPQAQSYVRAAAGTSNGFQLLYRILELVHPQLRAEQGGTHELITIPSYSDIDNNSIYTFMIRYQNYLLYESLSPQKRT